ncbi:GDSL esterase/lipase At5g03610-like [Olea europaea var. sylvestris]|uniref:GDSL esterase/lipase At5g03610-like n=1 Tax=Olea europaea var. sylvestris TaxID=158386 RepID=UPI000C1CD83F|nr:GDSL esterase/lipase At5g03610-like [Olea europaea var. sylvestris]
MKKKEYQLDSFVYSKIIVVYKDGCGGKQCVRKMLKREEKAIDYNVCCKYELVYDVQLLGEELVDRAKPFVFEDSYADAGNLPCSTASFWKQPYGITFPGRPSGRYSDGCVLIYRWRNFTELELLTNGLEDYNKPYKDLSTKAQVQILENLKNTNDEYEYSFFKDFDFGRSFNPILFEVDATKSLFRGDSTKYYLGIRSPVAYEWKKIEEKWIENGMNFAQGGTGVFNTLVDQQNMNSQINIFQQLIQENGLEAFTKSVIYQIVLNLKRIHEFRVQKIAVTGIVPLGCLPAITASTSYKRCSETGNNIAQFHNQVLQQNLHRLNNETGNSTFESGLKPCCLGVNVCENTKQSFFWDPIHPSDKGWRAVYSALKHSLHYLQ